MFTAWLFAGLTEIKPWHEWARGQSVEADMQEACQGKISEVEGSGEQARKESYADQADQPVAEGQPYRELVRGELARGQDPEVEEQARVQAYITADIDCEDRACATCERGFGEGVEEVEENWRGSCSTCRRRQCRYCMVLCNNCARAVCLVCHNERHWHKGNCLPALRSAEDSTQDKSLVKWVEWPESAVTYKQKVSHTIGEITAFSMRLDIDDYNKREVDIRLSALMKIRAVIAQVEAHFDVTGKDRDPNFVEWVTEEEWTAICYHCKVRKPSKDWGNKAKNSLQRRTMEARMEKTKRSDIWFCKGCKDVVNDGTAPLKKMKPQEEDKLPIAHAKCAVDIPSEG